MPRHVYNLLGVVNDVEAVLRGEGGDEAANVLARYVRAHLDLLESQLGERLQALADELDYVHHRLDELESGVAADLDGPDVETDEDGGDDSEPVAPVTPAVRESVGAEPGRARGAGTTRGSRFVAMCQDDTGNERRAERLVSRGKTTATTTSARTRAPTRTTKGAVRRGKK